MKNAFNLANVFVRHHSSSIQVIKENVKTLVNDMRAGLTPNVSVRHTEYKLRGLTKFHVVRIYPVVSTGGLITQINLYYLKIIDEISFH